MFETQLEHFQDVGFKLDVKQYIVSLNPQPALKVPHI